MSTVSSMKFIESLDPIITELMRNFNLITDLDLRSKNIMDDINENCDKFEQVSTEERIVLYKKIMQSCKETNDYSDDKIQLAQQTYDMIDKHVRRLDSELVKINTEYSKLYQEAMATEEANKMKQNEKNEKSKKKFKRNNNNSDHDNNNNNNNNTTTNGYSEPQPSTSASHSSGDEPIDSISKKSPLYLLPATLEPIVNNCDASDANPDENPLEAALALDMPMDPNEPIYCVCHQVCHGEMIACDKKDCPVEWFHFACVNIVTKPTGKWYCPSCEPAIRKRMRSKKRLR